MSACRIHTDDNGAWLQIPFIQEFIDDLKTEIPARKRRWSKERRQWHIEAAWVDTAVEIAERYYDSIEYAEEERGYRRATQPEPEPEQPDAWADLWLRPGAPPEVVKAAYRAMAQLHHPDRGGDTVTMQKINRAYELIEGGR